MRGGFLSLSEMGSKWIFSGNTCVAFLMFTMVILFFIRQTWRQIASTWYPHEYTCAHLSNISVKISKKYLKRIVCCFMRVYFMGQLSDNSPQLNLPLVVSVMCLYTGSYFGLHCPLRWQQSWCFWLHCWVNDVIVWYQWVLASLWESPGWQSPSQNSSFQPKVSFFLTFSFNSEG